MSKEQNNASGQNDGGHRLKITIRPSGIEVIDRLYDLEKQAKAEGTSLFGLYQSVPNCWCHFIVDDRGRPYHLAMRLLAEILFRHRPRQVKKTFKDGSVVIQLVKNFRDDMYQFNRSDLAKHWNVSKDAMSDALGALEKLELVFAKREDKDINCRGFRNMVFVTPNLDKIMELSSQALEKIRKIKMQESNREETPANTERHDAGSVGDDAENSINTERHHATTLPASCHHVEASSRDVTGIMPSRSPDHASVSRRSSEKPSASVSGSAEPNPSPKANDNNKSSAPQATQPSVVVVEPSTQRGLRPQPPTKGASPLGTPRATESRNALSSGQSKAVQFESQETSQGNSKSKSHRRNDRVGGAEHQTEESQTDRSYEPASAPAAQTACLRRGKKADGAPAPVPEDAAAVAADSAQPGAASTIEADKFVRFFEWCFPLIFGAEYGCGQEDLNVARRFFQLHRERSALQLANYLIRAWKLTFQKSGAYTFPCCKQGKTVRGFFKWFEPADGKHGIATDVENFHGSYWDDDQAWLIERLIYVCPDAKAILRDVFSAELAQADLDEKGELEEAAKREREAARQREQARQQEDAKLDARIKNPSKDDRKQSLETIQRALEIALGSSSGLPPSPARLDFAVKILGVDLPALLEWFESYGGRMSSPDTSGKKLPDELVDRLRHELEEIGSVLADIR